MLVRHNSREGVNQPGPYHYAHDTERVDVHGTPCRGRTDRVFTSERSRCPQCGSYGELVRIEKLERNRYPQGSTVSTVFLVDPPGVSAFGGGTVEPVEPVEPVTPEPVSEPVSEPVTVPPVERAPAPVAGDPAAALTELFRASIEQATAGLEQRHQAQLQATVDQLQAAFDSTVERLVVPVTVRVERPGEPEPVTLSGTTHAAFEECFRVLNSRTHEGHPLNLAMIGPSGSGKTTLARQLAEAFGTRYRITPQVLSPFDVLGFVDGPGNYHATPCYETHVHGGLHLGDEFDGWSPEAALAQHAMLANGYATFPNSPDPVERHADARWAVALNTWGKGGDREHVGRNEMDAASRSRFVFVPVDYDRGLETALSGEHREWRELVWHVRDRERELKIRALAGTRELVSGVALMNGGFDADRVAELVLKQDMDETTWGKVTP